jgi:hypothetical protein
VAFGESFVSTPEAKVLARPLDKNKIVPRAVIKAVVVNPFRIVFFISISNNWAMWVLMSQDNF